MHEIVYKTYTTRKKLMNIEPLAQAYINKDYQAAETLLQRGADPNIFLWNNRLIELAYAADDTRFVAILKRHNAFQGTVFQEFENFEVTVAFSGDPNQNMLLHRLE